MVMTLQNLQDQDIYRALKTELELRGDGGLIPVICPDPEASRSVIERLAEDFLNMGEMLIEFEPKTDYMTFFERALSEPDPALRMVHLIGIERLPESELPDVIGAMIRLSRNRGKGGPRIVLVWTTAAFDQNFFYNFPDFHYGVSAWFDFSGLIPPAEPAAAKAAEPPDPSDAVSIAATLDYLNAVVRQFENPGERDPENDPLRIPAMAEADLNAYYLPAYFSNRKGEIFPIDNLVRLFLNDDTVNFLTLAGAPGTGKTSFMIRYFVQLARDYVQSPEFRRIPIFLDLTGVEGEGGVEAFLLGWLKQRMGIEISLFALQDMLLRGRFILFVDGFDRMACRTDAYRVAGWMEGLNKLTLKNIILENGVEKPQPANKVLLASPPHYILKEVNATDPGAGYTSLYRDYAEKETHRLVRTNTKMPDEEGLKTFIRMRSGDGITARNLISLLDDENLINQLKCRDILVPIITRTVRHWRGRKEINLTDILQAYADEWIERDDWRFRMLPRGKAAFVRQLAVRLFHKSGGADAGVHFSELEPPATDHLKAEFQYSGADPFRNGAMACEFIERDAEGHYRFSHPTLRDFFLACEFTDGLREGRPQAIPYADLPWTVKNFIKFRLSSQKADLNGLDLSELYLDRANFYQGSLRETRLHKANLKHAVFMNADMAGAELTAAELSDAQLTRANLRNADMNSADMTNARLRQADLTRVNMNGVILRNADLRGAKLRGAKLAWADLREATLEGADLTGANLVDADLTGADLRGAILSEADMTGTSFSHADMSEAKLNSARMTRADLSHANLTEAEILWTSLREALMTFVNLSEAKVREVNLNRAIMTEAKAHHADFRRSTFEQTKLSSADLKESDFTEAVFYKAKLDRANLTSANLSKARLEETNLEEARMSMAKLIQTNLTRARLHGADLTWANLSGANLRKAVLEDADLNEADLSEAQLRDADLSGATFKGATLRGADLRNARYSESTFKDADLSDAILTNGKAGDKRKP